jgi:ABC-type branched-subunit amino acid transport system permease subunit
MSKKKKNQEGFQLPTVSEKKKPDPIPTSARVITVAYLVAMCAIWLISAFALFTKTDMLSMVLIGLVYFLCLLTMYLVRAFLEAKRRYNRTDGKAVFYYTQKLKIDQKWSIAVALSFFILFTVLSWLFRSPNLNMQCLYIATAFYLGFICTTSYKDEEEKIPFLYMEVPFLFLSVVTNWIVYLL